jgi:hypothetical protein
MKAIVERGEVPERSDRISDRLWELLNQCWSKDVNKRPTAAQVVMSLTDMREAAGIRGNMSILASILDDDDDLLMRGMWKGAAARPNIVVQVLKNIWHQVMAIFR